MKTAESAFLAKVLDRQIGFGNTWEDAISFAMQISGGPEAQLSALWKDPAPRSELETVQVAVLKQQLGVSEKQILSELGYSPEQIEQMQEEKKASEKEMGDRLLRTFEKGGEQEET